MGPDIVEPVIPLILPHYQNKRRHQSHPSGDTMKVILQMALFTPNEHLRIEVL